jgi:hypothetical protein
LLIASAFFVSVFAAVDSQAQVPFDNCEEVAELALLTSPIAPWKGAPLRVMFVTEKPLEGEFSLIAPNGKVAAKSRERHGGPPYFWFAEVESWARGRRSLPSEPVVARVGPSFADGLVDKGVVEPVHYIRPPSMADRETQVARLLS